MDQMMSQIRKKSVFTFNKLFFVWVSVCRGRCGPCTRALVTGVVAVGPAKGLAICNL